MNNWDTKEEHSKLDVVLKQIYSTEVVLEASHITKKRLLLWFLSEFEKFCFIKSRDFLQFYQGFYLTGSYFEGLRVKEASEFDVNVMFSFPSDESDFSISEFDKPLSYTTAQLKNFSQASPHTKFKHFIDNEQYLIPGNILKWFQSLLDTFFNQQNLKYPGVLMIKTSNSGPARTIKVLFRSMWISIDLVPVISLTTKYLHKYTLHHASQVAKAFSTCFLVPKPLKAELRCHMSTKMSKRAWRIHFPEAEKKFLEDKQCLKNVIKLAKALRDKENWPIPSYFIKVVAFWLVVKHPGQNYWNDIKLGCLFLQFLESLRKHLATRHLGHIFYPHFNLFHSLREVTLSHLQKRVENIIFQLRRNPKHAFKLFKTEIMLK